VTFLVRRPKGSYWNVALLALVAVSLSRASQV
jgi:hypothetical protein